MYMDNVKVPQSLCLCSILSLRITCFSNYFDPGYFFLKAGVSVYSESIVDWVVTLFL